MHQSYVCLTHWYRNERKRLTEIHFDFSIDKRVNRVHSSRFSKFFLDLTNVVKKFLYPLLFLLKILISRTTFLPVLSNRILKIQMSAYTPKMIY